MPTFAYKAKRGPDQAVDGEIAADNRAAAMAKLDALGLSPVSIVEVPSASASRRHRRGRVSSRDVTVFTRQLGGLLRAGVPILRALATIQQQTENDALRAVAASIVSGIRDGKTLSELTAQYPAHFSDLYRSMVAAGESAGVLDEMLLRLAEAREREDELRSRVVSAVAYPALVLAVGIASLFVILTFFLPRVVHLFEGTTTVLPLPTRVILTVSDFFAAWWYWLVAGVVAAGLAVKRFIATERGRLAVDGAVLRLPLIGRFMRDSDIVRFARTLALLIEAGIPIERALTLGGATLANSRLRAVIASVAANTIQKGMSLAAGFQRHPDFPAFVTSMVAVGEEGGRLDEVLQETALFYQRELDRDLRLVTTLLEPALILMVGAVIGFVIFAMLLPVFQIGQNLR